MHEIAHTDRLNEGEPQYAERIGCGTMHAAEKIREEFSDCVHDADDARKADVLISESSPPSAKNEIGLIAARSWKNETFGSVELTEFERSQIDFSETNVFHAQCVKAIANGLEVEDWLAHYDVTLSVDEHRVRLRQLAGESLTMRDLPMVLGGRL